MISSSIFRQHWKKKRLKIYVKFRVLLKILWKMEHLLFWSKCSIFHNISKYIILQRHQKALLWSKGLISIQLKAKWKTVLVLWFIYVISVLFCYAFMHVCLLLPCGYLLGRADLLALFVMSNCDVVTFPLVSWVRCGAWLHLFLIFALFLTPYPLASEKPDDMFSNGIYPGLA